MSALKVGELYAALGLRDTMTPDMGKAESTFKTKAGGMKDTARLDLDTSGFDKGLAEASKSARAGGQDAGDEFASGIGSKGSTFTSAGSGMGGMIAAGAAGALAAAGVVAADQFSKAFERQGETANLGISMGMSPEMAAKAGKLTSDIYAENFGDGIEDVNDALRGVGVNMGGFGDKSEDEVRRLTKGVLVLSDAFGVDLNEVTRAAGKLMKNGLAKDGTEALDIITRGLQSPANEAGDLLETFSEYSTQFRQLGISGPQALGLMNQGLAAGARDSDTIADGLKEFVIKAQEAVDPASQASLGFRTLGLDAADMARRVAEGGPAASEALQMTLDGLAAIEDPALRSQTAVQLFGTKSEDMAAAIAALDLSNATTQVGNIDGAMQNATTATDTNASSLAAWKRSAEENITNYINDTFIPALENLDDNWNDSTTWLGKFNYGLTGEGGLGDGLTEVKDKGIDPLWGSLQTLVGWLGDTIEKMEELGNWLDGEDGALGLLGAFGGVGGYAADLFADDGMVIPGHRGEAVPVTAHAGETILPTHKMSPSAAIRQVMGSGALPSFGNGGVVGNRKWVDYEDGSGSWQERYGSGWRNTGEGVASGGRARWEADQRAAMEYAAMVMSQQQAKPAAAAAPAKGAAGDTIVGTVMVSVAEVEAKLRQRSGGMR